MLRFKEEFRKLTENERNIIASEHAKFLKDFDAVANKVRYFGENAIMKKFKVFSKSKS
jgi:hypothetical protein